MKVREMIWVGIDVGKTHHHACAVDETGKVVFSKRLVNSQADIEALIGRAGKAAEQVRWALDMTSGTAGLLLAVLLAGQARVLYVPGRLVNRMAGAFAGEGKSDAKDAFTIAETARLRRDLTAITSPDQVVADLRVLTARREDLMGDWVRGINRLRALLASIFPALEASFDYSTRSALVLLTGFQTPQSIRDAGADGVTAHLLAGGAWPKGIPAMVDKALAAAAAQTIALPTEATTAPLIARLAEQLLDLDREIKDLDKQLTDRFAEHPHASRITSVPGFGPILGAQLLADTGGDLPAAFETAGRLAAYAGLAPVPRDSGRIRGNLRRPKRYHRGLRRVFYMAALSAIRPDGPSRVFYQRKRAEGKLHTQALIALARRLIDVIWALLRDGREFHDSPPLTANAA
ncbi:IS110 family transposase [Solwaraspora sp. WMMD937]|uniref:IS110 family transposase n=1 Tax=Solwaraspora sp. WMMD937 TaxID=3016090 RepID=UPI00249CCFB6|nr:IS110 family transposase [Solwaraspora sp. WMMD937]WFE20372.1 IS110 family transposase [Solwaraspora sp. WMMD937]WFE22401.1 IS110 family transposase [Solwaraspora sp. WMMD937]WFE23236.1 IS110 family transposase [Solwaraspora sp. WMMD937]